MRGEYEPDDFTENDVLRCLEGAGLKFKRGTRYILSQCPTHDDDNPSVQIYKDDWFVNCHAGCGRYHITKAFPELRPSRGRPPIQSARPQRSRSATEAKKVTEHQYKAYDLMEYWKALPPIPEDHVFKNIPIDVLHEMGWRLDVAHNGYFIPYFSASRGSIPFGQWRHLSGERRFTMLKDARPTCYGTWNLDNDKLFVVEGTSDCAVLQHCFVPWIGLPSAASGKLMRMLADYCTKNAIQLIYAGDNDAAGEKLREALDEVTAYRVCQPPKQYKDWGDFIVVEGALAVQRVCFKELGWYFEDEHPNIASVFPGAQRLDLK
jgi:hypothetical protein